MPEPKTITLTGWAADVGKQLAEKDLYRIALRTVADQIKAKTMSHAERQGLVAFIEEILDGEKR